MDFAEFAEKYQRRTAKRLQDFEAAIRAAQRTMEVTAQQHAIARELYPQRPVYIPRGDYTLPRKLYEKQRQGQVRSVLRREGPGTESEKPDS